MTTTALPICYGCKNLLKDEEGLFFNCKAFSDDVGGIPMEILEGKNKHTKPLKDQDNDIVFEKE